MINDLKLIENIEILFNNKIVLYGTGICGVKIYRTLKMAGLSIVCFCDSNPQKSGKFIDGVEIIELTKLKLLDLKENIIIIIATEQQKFIEQIICSIDSIKLTTTNIFTYLGLEISLIQNINCGKFNKEFLCYYTKMVEFIKSHNSYERNRINTNHYFEHIGAINEILIYQPAKVGSSTIYHSLSEMGILSFQFHFLAKHDAYSKECNSYLDVYLNQRKKFKNVKIITLVREPLSRCFSSFFYAIGSHSTSIIPFGEPLLQTFLKYLGEESFNLLNNFGNEFDWFDQELKAVFGVDVYTHPFDRDKGYSIIKQDNIEVLLMKLEKLNTLESVIGEFVNAPDFKLVNANESDDKPYKYLYKNVREVIKIPRDIVDSYYKDPRMDHFYTEEEKSVFLKKWENNIEG